MSYSQLFCVSEGDSGMGALLVTIQIDSLLLVGQLTG